MTTKNAIREPIPQDLEKIVVAVEDVTGKRMCLSTVRRWALKPRYGIRLRVWVIGGVYYTNESSVIEYIEAMTLETVAMTAIAATILKPAEPKTGAAASAIE